MSTKPNWHDAPEWASYLAKDKNGSWSWFENKPWRDEGYWDARGMESNAGYFIEHDWRESLEEKPKVNPKLQAPPPLLINEGFQPGLRYNPDDYL